MQKKRASLLNLAVLLTMLLSLVAGPVTVNAASHEAPASMAAAAFTPGNLVVYRIGDGIDSLVSTGNKVFLDEYTPAGVLVQSIALPTAANGNNKPLYASGTAITEGLITRSTDGRYLLFTGYAKTHTDNLANTAAGSINRVVARVDANGAIDTSTALIDFASNNSPRSAVSTNGTDLWIGGGTGGVRYTTLGASTSTQLGTDLTNVRQVHIFDSQLYASASSNDYRLVTVGAGTPTTAGQAINRLPGFPTTTGNPYGFFLADLSASVPGVDTLYVTDDNNSTGGIFKYSLVEGAWAQNGPGVAPNTYRGMTGVVDGTTVTLFAVGKTGSSGGGQLVSLVDSGGYNQPFSSRTPTVIATARTYTVMRGVALAPVAPVDNTPTVIDTTPIDGAVDVPVNTNITVSFSEAVTAPASAFSLKCGEDDQEFAIDGSEASFTIIPAAGLPYGSLCVVTITGSLVTDQDGAPTPMEGDVSWSFTTAADTAPQVTGTMPASGAADIAVGSTIGVTFSKDVTAPEAAFTLTCAGEEQGFTLSGSGSVYTIDPISDLPYGQACAVTVIASQVIEPMSADYTWSFTTLADLAPEVSSTTPTNGAARVAVNATLSLTFSESVTAPAAAFALTCGGEVQAFSFSGSEAVYTLDPDGSLPYDQTCSVTVTGAQVTDLDGEPTPMTGDYTWAFTTVNDPGAVTPIAEARAAGADWTGTLQGSVIVPPSVFSSKSYANTFAIQDATGGMYIYSGNRPLPPMTTGDVVQITGTIKDYYGLLEIDPTTSVSWVDSGAAPTPLQTSTGSIASTQGKLIEVSGTVTWTGTPPAAGAGNFTLTIDDGSGPAQVYIYGSTQIDLSGFASGQQMRIIGFSGHYRDKAQINPRFQSDLIDLRPATVTSVTPPDQSSGVSPYKPLSAAFNKAMDPASLTGSSFTLTASGSGAPVSGQVSYNDSASTAFFTPDGPLAAQTTYTATLTNGIKDVYGTALAAPYIWSFTTGDVDATPPQIVDRSPLPGAANVPLSTQVTVTFSEELHTSVLEEDFFTLTGPYGAVPAVLAYDPSTFTITLRPETSLLPTTDYTMTVSGETADTAGNTMGLNEEWSFTTSVEPPMQVYFGDLHNHTSYSDGSGTPTEALAAGQEAGFDFMAISDHSYAVDDAEWASTLAAVEAATTADFVALRGFEYTQGAEGHINVWNSEKHATRTNETGCASCEFTPNLEAGQTVQGFYPWLVAATTQPLDEAGMVMQFNHPGWINFNDWFYHPEVSAIARLEEVGNGSGTSYVFSEDEYIRSLDYGWRLGATNNADTHSIYWGTNTDNRTGALMPELTKAALLEALRQRRTFSSEDKNYSLTMKANGAWMGAEIANAGQIQFEISGSDPDGESTTLVQLITDQGKVAAQTSPNTADFHWNPQLEITTGVHYFYIKVTQADGNRMVTSPVWTLGSEDLSITDIVIQPTIPTVHSPSLLTARVTNRGVAARTVTVNMTVNDVPLLPAVEVTVPPNGDAYANFSWQPTATGPVTITASYENIAGDNPEDDSASLVLTVTDEHLPLILIDAGHGNMNALGREMRSFVEDLSDHQYNVLKNLDGLTAEDLNPAVVKLLIITAPQYAYSADELTAIANFVKAGGSLWLCGLADYTGKVPWADTVAARQNAILDKIEAVTGQAINLRMNDDEVIDGNSNNGYVFGVTWSDFPSADATGIGVNVASLASWSLNSIRGRTVNDPLTASTPGVHILMQGDLDEGFTDDTWKNPFHTSNTDADGAGDAYLYNPTWTSGPKPADAIPLPGAAVTQLQNGAGRILLYGDSSDPFNTFAYTAGDSKQNELFNLQSVMWLLGTPLEKSTVAEARSQVVEDQPDHLNRLVWVEGEITAAYGEFFNVLYVQDETGGITVHAPAGDIDPSAFTRGTRVRAVGTIGIYNGDTEIEFFEAEMVQVIGPSGGEPTPAPLTTHQAADEANEGWLAVVTGTVTDKSGAEAIEVDDGSGPVRVFLDGYNGSFEDIEEGSAVRVVGLVSEDDQGQRVRVRNYKQHAQYADDVTVLNRGLEITTAVTAPQVVDLFSEITYTIELENNSAEAVEQVSLADTLPVGISFGAFVENKNGVQVNNGVLSWGGSLATGEEVRVVFTARVNKDYSLYGKTITNTAAYSSTLYGNGSSSAAFTVAAAPVVTLHMSADAGKEVELADVVTYTLELSNTGPATAYNVRLTDDLPDGVTFTTFTTSSGAVQTGSRITWSGNLLPGQAVKIVFTVTTASSLGYSGLTITNFAQFTSDNAGSGADGVDFTFVNLHLQYMPFILKNK